MKQYKNVRENLINEWFGSGIADAIKKDEEEIAKNPIPEPMDDEKPEFHSTPSDVTFTGDEGPEPSGPPEGLIGGEDQGTEDEINIDVTDDNSNEPPQDIPYSLK